MTVCTVNYIKRESFPCKIVNKYIYFFREQFSLLKCDIFFDVGLHNVFSTTWLIVLQIIIHDTMYKPLLSDDDELAAPWINHDCSICTKYRSTCVRSSNKKKKNYCIYIYLKCCFIFTYHKSLNFDLGKRHHLI